MKSSIISSYAGRLENIVSAEKLSRVASKIIVGIILPAAMKILTVFMAHHYVLRSDLSPINDSLFLLFNYLLKLVLVHRFSGTWINIVLY